MADTIKTVAMIRDAEANPEPHTADVHPDEVANYTIKTVAMIRDAEANPEPHTADVHPDEVANYQAAGWSVADPLDHDGDGKKGGSKPKAATDAA